MPLEEQERCISHDHFRAWFDTGPLLDYETSIGTESLPFAVYPLPIG
jgi:hypothetical protein